MRVLMQLFFWLGLLVISTYGYVMNIVEIAHSTGITGMLILRVCGIFVPPLGVILGYIN